MKRKIMIIMLSVIILALLVCGGILFISHKNSQTKIKNIVVTSMPTKTNYYVDESMDLSGLEIKAVLKNGKYTTIELKDCDVKGFDSSAPKTGLDIYIYYKEFITTFKINILEKPIADISIKSISMYKMPKTEYKVGEFLDVSNGSIKINYSDNSYDVINLLSNYVYGFDSSKPNDNLVLTVKYKEKGKIYTTTFSVVIKE